MDGHAIFEKIKERYSECQTFSCIGTSVLEHTAGKDERTFLILFERPGHIRVDWTQSKFLRPGKQTSSIYTEDDQFYSYSSVLGGPKPYPSIRKAIGVEAGVSGGISYLIPPLLLGDRGYLSHWEITRGVDTTVADIDCYTISLETKGYGYYSFEVSKADFSIVRATNDAEASVVNAQRERARKENPNWFKDPPGTPKNTFSSKKVIQFQEVKFDSPIAKDDFRFVKTKS